MTLRTKWALAATPLLAWAVGCGGCDGGNGTAVDAGPDMGAAEEGGGPEGGSDTDAASDAGADATAMDADTNDGGDGGEPPRDGGPVGWTPLPGLPEGCAVERAEHPEELFTAAWVPCPDGFSGCSKLAPVEHTRSVHPFAGFHDGETGYFAITRAETDSSPRTMLMARTEGPAVAAWRDPATAAGTCIVGTPGFGPSAASFLIRYTSADGSARQNRVYRASYDAIGAVTEPQAVLTLDDLGGSHLQNVVPWGSRAAGEVQPAAYVAVMPSDRVHRLDPIAGVPQRVHLVDDHAIWEEWGSTVRLVHGSADQEPGVYYELPDGDVKGFATDGEDMAWVQGYDRQPDGSYARVELWTAGYVRDAADVEARKVADLGTRVTQARVGSGYYGLWRFDGWHQIHLYRLSDGRFGRWTLPEGTSPRGPPLYIAADEVAISATGGTMFRVPLSAFDWTE